MVVSSKSKYFFEKIKKVKQTKAEMSEAEVTELLRCYDYINYNIRKYDETLCGVNLDEIKTSSVMGVLLSPKCVTVSTDYVNEVDLIDRGTAEFTDFTFSDKRFRELQLYFFSLFKTGKQLDTSLDKLMERVSLTTQKDCALYVGTNVYFKDLKKLKYPVKLKTDVLERVATVSEDEALERILDSILENVTGKTSIEG